MATDPKRYWFHAKDPAVGIGWDAPASWQGWTAIGLYVVLLIAAGVVLLPARFGLFLMAAGTLSATLLGVCLVKGEPLHGHR